MKNTLLFSILLCSCFVGFGQWAQTEGPEGGSLGEIVELNGSLFVAANESGIYKSSDNGANWFSVNNGLPTGAQILDLHTDNNTVYASVGRNGLYKSENEGESWMAINSGIATETFYAIYANGNNIYGGNENGGITYSNNGGQSYSYVGEAISGIHFRDFEVFNSRLFAVGNDYEGGFYESTDNGQSWIRVDVDNLFDAASNLMVMEDRLFIVSSGRVFSTQDVLSWTASSTLFGYGISNIDGYLGSIYVTGSGGKIYKSDDLGQNWQLIQNENVVTYGRDVFLSGDVLLLSSVEGMFGSLDDGDTWLPYDVGIKAVLSSSVLPYQGNVFVGSRGQGVFRSGDSGATWQRINTGMNTNGSRYIFEIIGVDGNLFVASEDGIYKSTDSGGSWQLIFDPGINQSTWDVAHDNGIVITASSGTSIYKSSDMGGAWSQLNISALQEPAYFRELAIMGDTLAISTSDSQIYLSPDMGATWKEAVSIGYSGAITDIEVSGNKLFVSNYNGVYVSSDFGDSWERLNDERQPVPYGVRDIIANDSIYAATLNGVWVTSVNRNEWYDISENLANQGVNRIAFDSDYLWAGTSSSTWKLAKDDARLPPPVEYPFVTQWYTGYSGTSNDNQITIPTFPGESYNYMVDWGDGSVSEGVTGDITHTYAEIGDYTVTISGEFPRIYFNGTGDAQKINRIVKWGTTKWTSMEDAFKGCIHLSPNAEDLPDLSLLTSLKGMFRNATYLYSQYGNIGTWDVSTVTDFSYMFAGVERPLGHIGNWNISSAESMEGMFQNATKFNQDLTSWNVTNVTNLNVVFEGAIDFDGDVSSWNVANATSMTRMFNGAVNFNGKIAEWDIGSVGNMQLMLNGVSLSMEEYDTLLTSWSGLSELQNNVTFDAGQNHYCNSADERQILVDTYGWTINDAGEECTPDTSSFITVWKTDNQGDASTETQITIPTHPEEVYNYRVDWGDGTLDEGITGNITHDYETPGVYTVTISGQFPRIFFNNNGDKNKIIRIQQWGTNPWSSMEFAFMGCNYLDVNAEDAPNITEATSLQAMFMYCNGLTGNDSFASWDTSAITNMASLFRSCYNFNGSIGSWDVSEVHTMEQMFSGASNFNDDISAWNVGKVSNMQYMFAYNHSFVQDISSWDTGSLVDSRGMFEYNNVFNQNIGNWDVSKVQNMNAMFRGANSFNQDIANWDVSNVENMAYMFHDATGFNWDLSQWDVSRVLNMEGMFQNARLFNQNLADWDIQTVGNLKAFFDESGLSDTNYDLTLLGWAQLASLQPNVLFEAGTNKYCDAEEARQHLMDAFGWSIYDGGKARGCGITDFALRINTGGTATAYDGNEYVADTYFDVGNT
ncbi:MAG: BspA family leucine-rich repeat surface protein, partial [Flavobacteriaceae bacterium]